MMIPILAAITLAAAAASKPGDPCAAPSAQTGTPIPVDYSDGRFFVRWSLRGGDVLRLYLDTGGPRDNLLSGTVQRLGLARQVLALEGDSVSWVRIPRAVAEQLSPALRSNTWQDTVHAAHDGTVRVMATFPGSFLERLAGDGPAGKRVDGILGPDWFAGRVWTLDYPGQRLYYHGTDAVASVPLQCWVPLGFQVDSAGTPTSNFPRITAVIDGDSIDFLFDAGAMTTLTDSAWRVIEPQAGQTRATSFIVHERFENWRVRHPDWLVIDNADNRYHNRMIQVPVIEVGGQRLGPVWFSERPDASFRSFFSQWMDRQIDGALGGSAWRNAIVVLDYPRSRAAVLSGPIQ